MSRIGRSTAGLTSTGAPLAPDKDGDMADKEHLLSDEEVQRFIVDGYTTVQAGFPTPVHDEICQKVDEVFEKEGNVGNNLLPRVPEIQ